MPTSIYLGSGGGGGGSYDQSLNTTDSPEFAGVTIGDVSFRFEFSGTSPNRTCELIVNDGGDDVTLLTVSNLP